VCRKGGEGGVVGGGHNQKPKPIEGVKSKKAWGLSISRGGGGTR